jgi:hypothetical protein
MDMNKLRLATTVEHELFDGSTVKCTLAMYRLKMLASKDKGLYAHAMKVLGKGTDDVFESIKMLYAAYVCANMDSDDLMTEDDFMMACGSDYAGVTATVGKLINPKNRKASGDLSN